MDYLYPNKKQKIEQTSANMFVLNNNSYQDYKYIDPVILIIILNEPINQYISNKYYNILTKNGIKYNITKIITSENFVFNYMNIITEQFSIIYPNCNCIQVNNLYNQFENINTIINNLKIITSIEYVLNDYIYMSNSFMKYDNFIETIFSNNISNIKNYKIINDINYKDIPDNNPAYIKKKIDSIITIDKINTHNNLVNDKINNLLTLVYLSLINTISFEYVDKKNNINFKTWLKTINYDIYNSLL